MCIIISYYFHIYYHILAFISITNLFTLSYTGLFLWGKKEHGHNYPMKELTLMCLLNNASVYCQQTQQSLLVSGLWSVLRCNWCRKAGVLLLGDNSESNTSGLCVALHALYHLVWSYLFGVWFSFNLGNTLFNLLFRFGSDSHSRCHSSCSKSLILFPKSEATIVFEASFSDRASFAASSASLLPFMLIWLGIQQKTISFPLDFSWLYFSNTLTPYWPRLLVSLGLIEKSVLLIGQWGIFVITGFRLQSPAGGAPCRSQQMRFVVPVNNTKIGYEPILI